MKARQLIWSLPLVALAAVVVMQSGVRAQSKPVSASLISPDPGSGMAPVLERVRADRAMRRFRRRRRSRSSSRSTPKAWQDRIMAGRAADAKGEPLATNYTDCLPDGMPTMMGAMFPMEILQSRGQVTIIEEAFTQVRRILMDKPQKSFEDVEPGFYGHSVGRWDGDTLVVDTIGIKENVRFQNMPHSPQMRIKERMKLVSPNVLWNEITIEDPVVFEKPHTYTVAYRRMPDYTLLEYVCEDNREYADDKGRQKIRIN